MPELPDITIYQDALRERVLGARISDIVVLTPFLLRSVSPPLTDFVGATVVGVERLGKRLVLAFDGERFLVMHLMIAGRLQWTTVGKKPFGRAALEGVD